MPFFIRGKGKVKPKKRKVLKGTGKSNTLDQSKLNKNEVESNDEEIESEDEEEEEELLHKPANKYEESEYKEIEEETPQEKKIRLAKQYLEELRKEREEEDSDDEGIEDSIGTKLREDVLEAAGKLQRAVADQLSFTDTDSMKILRCKQQKLPLTCLIVSYDEKFIYTASKDCSIVKWNIHGEKLCFINGGKNKDELIKCHRSHILSISVSMDNLFLASGDRDGIIHIWDAATLNHLHTFKKHRGPVSGLVFRKGSHTLYSASHDRQVMTWNLDVMGFAECLGGHRDCITGIDSLFRESCITCGGRDEMVIVYVIPEEKQLRFSFSQESIDGVKLINERAFITFGQDGSLALWSTMKKKPHFKISAAHGINEENGVPNWITSAAAFVNCDVVATGSYDGYIRVWKILQGQRKLETLFCIPLAGVINDLVFTTSGSHLIAAVGQEHKLGRWFKEKSVKNSVVIIPLSLKPS